MAMFGNPSMIHLFNDSWHVLTGTERRYLSEIVGNSASIVKRIGPMSGVGFKIGSYGIDEFKTTHLALAYARSLSRRIAIGYKYRLEHLVVKSHGENRSGGITLGLCYMMAESTRIGLNIENLIYINDLSDRPSLSISLGGITKTQENLEAFWDVEYQASSGSLFKIGFRYHVLDVMWISLGLTSGFSVVSFGFGIQLPLDINMVFGSMTHQYLGTTVGLTLGKHIK